MVRGADPVGAGGAFHECAPVTDDQDIIRLTITDFHRAVFMQRVCSVYGFVNRDGYGIALFCGHQEKNTDGKEYKQKNRKEDHIIFSFFGFAVFVCRTDFQKNHLFCISTTAKSSGRLISLDGFPEIGEKYGFQTSRGTNFRAGTATRAGFVVNRSKVVLNGYRTARTGFFAFFASDAGVFASLACIGAFVLVVAHHDGFGILRNHGDDVLRTNGNAHSATETAAGVHVCNAVLYADGVVRASVGAIAQTETAEAARPIKLTRLSHKKVQTM